MNILRISAAVGVLVVLSIGIGVAQDTKGASSTSKSTGTTSKNSQMYPATGAKPPTTPVITKSLAVEVPTAPPSGTTEAPAK